MVLDKTMVKSSHNRTSIQPPLVLNRWMKAPPAQDRPVISKAYTGSQGRDTYLEKISTAVSICPVAGEPEKRL